MCVFVCVKGNETAGEKRITPSFLCFIENSLAPFVLSNKSFVLREGEGGDASPFYLLNSPTLPRWQERESPLLLLNLTFHSRKGHLSSRESLLALCRGNENKNMFACTIFFFVPPSSVDTRAWPSHTHKTLNRRGSDSRVSTALWQDMVM